MANLAIPVPAGYFKSVICDGSRPKLYKNEQKRTKDGVPQWLMRCRLLPEGSTYAVWADVTVAAQENPYPVVDEPVRVELSGLRLNIGDNSGKKYWSFACDGVEER